MFQLLNHIRLDESSTWTVSLGSVRALLSKHNTVVELKHF